MPEHIKDQIIKVRDTALIEQITVHENGTFTVEFKSGTMVEV